MPTYIRRKGNISLSELKELLSYTKSTGIFKWKVKRRGGLGIEPGDVAGTIDNDGYIQIRINQKGYKAHRLAWFYVTGKWPIDEIDHKNRIKTDNRFRNLRPATRAENQQNQKTARSNNKCGWLGVHKVHDKRFVAVIGHKGESYQFGNFDNPLSAHQAYVKVKRKIHSHNML